LLAATSGRTLLGMVDTKTPVSGLGRLDRGFGEGESAGNDCNVCRRSESP
jgi:hypothetical protein